MREQDIINKEYFADNERVADLINVFLFQGKQRIRAEDISEEDSAASGSVERFGKNVVKQKYRDLFRRITMGVCFAFVGIEEQGVVHFAMPVRAMGYDFLSYDKQVKQLQRKTNY